jgi:hypothetical protein
LQNGQSSTGAVAKLALVIWTVKNAWVKSVYHTTEYTICSHFMFLHAQMYLPSNENSEHYKAKCAICQQTTSKYP